MTGLAGCSGDSSTDTDTPADGDNPVPGETLGNTGQRLQWRFETDRAVQSSPAETLNQPQRQ